MSTFTNTRCFVSTFSTAGLAWYLSRYLHHPHVGDPNARNTAFPSPFALAWAAARRSAAGSPLGFGLVSSARADRVRVRHSTATRARDMANSVGWATGTI